MQAQLGDLTPARCPGTGVSKETSTTEVGGFRISDEWCAPGRELGRPDGERASIFFAAVGSFTEESDRQRVRHEELDVVLRPPGHRASLRANEQRVRCIVIELSPERLTTVQAETSLFRSSFDVPATEARELARRLAREIGRGLPSALRLEAMVLELLAYLARLDPCEPDWARAMTRAAESMTPANDISRVVGVPASEISRYVRERHGCTVPEYVRRCRIVAAAEALATSRDPIARIAAEFGFHDQSHFTKKFKSELGMTPRQYRAAFGKR